MNVLGLSITRTKAIPPLSSVSGRGGWLPYIRESFTGAWQRNVELTTETVLAYAAVYACVTLIASDIGKLRIKLVKQDADGIWNEVTSPAFSPVLNKPNRYQTRIKFLEQWMTSKLIYGNTYVLKQRDNRRVVTALYVLDPQRVKPLVAPDGSVYYQVDRDDLSQATADQSILPASEIIHDVMVPLYHPLVGVSPISACGLAAVQGLRVQNNSAQFFGNASMPSGVLTAPGTISDETAKRIQKFWDDQISGANLGGTAVLGDGLTYEQMTMSAVDAQLIEQLKWTAENVCQAFHVPGYMVGVGGAPAYNNVEALSQQYYSQTLQNPIESIELLLDEGLELVSAGYGAELDLDELLRMNESARVLAAKESANGGGMTFNEVRKRYHGLGKVVGGNAVLSQQQNYSLEALAKRDASDDPFKANTSNTPPTPSDITPDDSDEDMPDQSKRLEAEFRKAFPVELSA